jgi:hypothetical protein
MIRYSDFWPSSSWDRGAEHQKGVFSSCLLRYSALRTLWLRTRHQRASLGRRPFPQPLARGPFCLPYPPSIAQAARQAAPVLHRYPSPPSPPRSSSRRKRAWSKEGGFVVGFLTDLVRPPGNAGIKTNWKRP